MGEEEDGSLLCRYCFGDESDGQLISPCNCAGGQKYVHLACLRRWQRMVLVSQPTHPAFYTSDKRHHICNVCLARYTCPPPSRAELMESFTGPEIAAMIDEGRIIAASPGFSDMLLADRNDPRLRRRGPDSYDFWYHNVYLITSVKQDVGNIKMIVDSNEKLEALRRQMARESTEGELGLDVNGARYLLTTRGSLEGVDPNLIETALSVLSAPATLYFAPIRPPNCSDDHVAAVCISRLLTSPERLEIASLAVARATQRLQAEYTNIKDDLVVQHFDGGPCDTLRISCCLVRGGPGRGWTIVKDLNEALALAHQRRQYMKHGDISSGLGVRFTGLQSRSDLNGQLGMALRFDEKAGRWEVRVAGSGEGIKVRPVNIVLLETEPVHLQVFWGDAQWTRAQLLGEIARGSWGLCRGDIQDLIVPLSQRWSQLQESGRLAYAPVTEMSEDYIRNATNEMESMRVNALAARQATGDNDAE
ncbi:unnamed protein product [Aphanomyces euteiches]|uniref:RING-CH-type domain-containing protein n=1 Tax=Aphanomyces euteiches TaxID=100861 RepID=A0A6G0WJD3_9STRA|nr:hypothetical protein Ae201684_014609 [Aphanomyces euteiches]KAH9081134.1 hypothetical protein Ae201684P_012106 [Aphanomyces euteiches]KAH9139581.1 hypothetical protein AeRB84_016144 [Aphanomyces euteiches]